MRNISLSVAALSLVFLLNSRLPAAAENDAQETGYAAVIDLHNILCPVSMKKIDAKTKVAYEYKGKIFSFCSKACMEEFKKAPEKYIKAILRDGGKKIGKTANKEAEEENAQDDGDEE